MEAGVMTFVTNCANAGVSNCTAQTNLTSVILCRGPIHGGWIQTHAQITPKVRKNEVNEKKRRKGKIL